MHIRDPIHGAVEITAAERAIIDSRPMVRLRHVRQLGFAEIAFPGATHTRFAHSVGAMAVASRVFDAVFREVTLPEAERRRLRQALRVAVLLHDVGHPPLSHAAEHGLPALAALQLPGWLTAGRDGRAGHEDMGLKLVTDSELARLVEAEFGGQGIGPEQVAALMSGREPPSGPPFVAGGVDWGPLLGQIVSSEIDADRMDYLYRDSTFTGVNYGRYDLDWITQNLAPTVRDGKGWLAVDRRAILAVEDFLLSRYHMFMAVYFHRASVAYEKMLGRYHLESPGDASFPADPDAYLRWDDVELLSALRRSSSPWAQRIVERRGYRAVYEQHPGDPDEAPRVQAALTEAGIDHLTSASRGEVSRYLGRRTGIFVRTRSGEVPIESYAGLLRRHADVSSLVRVYVAPEALDAARACIAPPA